MKKLRNVLAAALLTIPLASGASVVVDASAGPELRPTRSVAYCCTVYFAGRYWCLPC